MASKFQQETPKARLIAFPRGAGAQLAKFAGLAGIDTIGLDTATDPRAAVAALPERVTLQGDLQSLALVAGRTGLDEQIDRVLSGFKGRPHIFNLGHGVVPETPVDRVERLVARVRGQTAP